MRKVLEHHIAFEPKMPAYDPRHSPMKDACRRYMGDRLCTDNQADITSESSLQHATMMTKANGEKQTMQMNLLV
jgi:hypothetical protein